MITYHYKVLDCSDAVRAVTLHVDYIASSLGDLSWTSTQPHFRRYFHLKTNFTSALQQSHFDLRWTSFQPRIHSKLASHHFRSMPSNVGSLHS